MELQLPSIGLQARVTVSVLSGAAPFFLFPFDLKLGSWSCGGKKIDLYPSELCMCVGRGVSMAGRCGEGWFEHFTKYKLKESKN